MYVFPSLGTLTGACRPRLKHLAKGCRRSALRKRRVPPVPPVPFSGRVLQEDTRWWWYTPKSWRAGYPTKWVQKPVISRDS